MAGVIGEKIGMTHLLKEDGTCVPVTVVKIEPNRVIAVHSHSQKGEDAKKEAFE